MYRTNKGSQKVKAYLSFVGYTNPYSWEESSLRKPGGDTEAQGSQVCLSQRGARYQQSGFPPQLLNLQ